MVSEYEPANDKTYDKICATSEDSDQPAHPRSLTRVLVDCKYLLLSPDGVFAGHAGLTVCFVVRWLFIM